MHRRQSRSCSRNELENERKLFGTPASLISRRRGRQKPHEEENSAGLINSISRAEKRKRKGLIINLIPIIGIEFPLPAFMLSGPVQLSGRARTLTMRQGCSRSRFMSTGPLLHPIIRAFPAKLQQRPKFSVSPNKIRILTKPTQFYSQLLVSPLLFRRWCL